MLNIGSSIEFCGGCHVARTGDIGSFKIISEAGVAAGVRRIEAQTGMNALRVAQHNAEVLNDVVRRLNVKTEELPAKVSGLLDDLKSLEKALDQLKSKMASRVGDSLIDQGSEAGETEGEPGGDRGDP